MGAEEIMFEREMFDPLDLPVTAAKWNNRFSEFLRKEKCEWLHLEASSGLLVFDGGDLGRYVMRFEHDVRPLRWVLRQNADSVSIRLIDETGQVDVDPQCYFFDMERPRALHRVNLGDAVEGFPIGAPGGLYVAKTPSYHSALVVSAGLTCDGLEGLGVQPSHGHLSSEPEAIVKLLQEIRNWHNAGTTGYLAGARRHQVMDTLVEGFLGIMAGWKWVRAEKRLILENDVESCMDRLHSLVEKKVGFASAICLKAPTVRGDQKAFFSWYFDLSKRFDICSDKVLCDFVMELAHQPYALTTLYPENLAHLVRQAQCCQNLIRGARLAVLSRMIASEQPPALFVEANS
jgi:hypothetical protein